MLAATLVTIPDYKLTLVGATTLELIQWKSTSHPWVWLSSSHPKVDNQTALTRC
jgi:hypothetical protein